MTGVGNNSGFESLLYLDGKPYQGVDVNHKEEQLFSLSSYLILTIKTRRKYFYQECPWALLNISQLELWAKEDTEKEVRPELPQGLDGFEQMKVGESWSGRDKYLWLKANISTWNRSLRTGRRFRTHE